jgi:hypothetical protein
LRLAADWNGYWLLATGGWLVLRFCSGNWRLAGRNGDWQFAAGS